MSARTRATTGSPILRRPKPKPPHSPTNQRKNNLSLFHLSTHPPSMKFNISKEWVLHQARLEEGLEIGTAALPKNPAPLKSLDWSLFPVKEMFKRSWFTGFGGSLAEAKAHASALVEEYITRAIPRPVVSLQPQPLRPGS